MKKKILILSALLSFFSLPTFAKAGFEFGLGSGYVFYGDKATRDKNDLLSDINQIVLATDAAFLIPANDYVIFSLGGDGVFDLRWHGSDHIYLIDYAFLAGFRVYPNFGGLYASIDYALGRRSDFYSIENKDSSESTKWGNGFKIGIGYDFSYHLNSIAPEIFASLKSMPRGGTRDTLFCVSLKLTKHK
ncbi:MAG: hypothetical protein IJ530_07965 [Treponema sp.]|uniref:hypothetical protein n=1 Tax=Treponema sp. TaxID=166 RepID=UPI0025F52227|nr:hypothetical protein [Treponema sp.]MBQ8679685.1 hypothetical protein [Treponema sp.]